MSVSTIVVSPHHGDFSFNVKFCQYHVSVIGAGFSWGEVNEKLPAVLEVFGCSVLQIEVILRLLEERTDYAYVKEDGSLEEEEE